MADPIKDRVAEQAFRLLDLDGLDRGSYDSNEPLTDEQLWNTQFQQLSKHEALFWVPIPNKPRRCFKIKVTEVM